MVALYRGLGHAVHARSRRARAPSSGGLDGGGGVDGERARRRNFYFGAFFIVGAALADRRLNAPWLENAPAQWLGRISYSLYLSHWLVFALAARAFGLKDGFFEGIFIPRVDDSSRVAPTDCAIGADFYFRRSIRRTPCKNNDMQGKTLLMKSSNSYLANIVPEKK